MVFFQIFSHAQRAYSLQIEEALLADNYYSVSNHQPNLFYFSFGTSLTNFNLGASANIIFSNNWKFSFGYRYDEREAKNKPSNFQPRSTLFGTFKPVDKIQAFTAMAGRISPNISSKGRVGFETGPSFLYYKEMHFTPGGGWFGGNYSTNFIEKYTFGLSLRTNIEIAIFPFLGAEIALNANINKYQSYIVIELYLLIGIVQNKNTK